MTARLIARRLAALAVLFLFPLAGEELGAHPSPHHRQVAGRLTHHAHGASDEPADRGPLHLPRTV